MLVICTGWTILYRCFGCWLSHVCRRVNLAVLDRSAYNYLPAHCIRLRSAQRLERKSCFTLAHKGKYNSLDVVWEPPLSWETLFLGSLSRLEAETECTHRHRNLFSDCPSGLVVCVRPPWPDLLCSSSDTMGQCSGQWRHCLASSAVTLTKKPALAAPWEIVLSISSNLSWNGCNRSNLL